ncbi:hypothetical protein [Algibacter pacificus]|uniref:hypothetical protein n=1 Tax=Algibacter pacificus TaxID=2599389 RepID=UPI001FE502BF|nr:hypothetical protein [Algibacter pacificus]
MKKSEKYYIDQYQSKGYTSSFQVKDEKLIDLNSKKGFSPNAISIVAEHRFEGMTNPSDMSILYVIEAGNHSKGTVLVPYGPANVTAVAEFFTKVPKAQSSNAENINNK